MAKNRHGKQKSHITRRLRRNAEQPPVPIGYRDYGDDMSPEEEAAMAAEFERDRRRAAAQAFRLDMMRKPIEVQGKPFVFAKRYDDDYEDLLSKTIYRQLEDRGLCKSEPVGDGVSIGLYLDERIQPDEFNDLLGLLKNAIEGKLQTANPGPINMDLLTNRVLKTEPFAPMQAISQEFLGEQTN